MTGRSIILIVAGVIILAGMILYRIEATSTNIVANSSNFYNSQNAQNIAQTGVNMGLRQLVQDRSWRTGFALMNLLNGKVSVRVFDTTFALRKVIAVSSTGIMAYHTNQEVSLTSTAYVPAKFIPSGALGLITAQTDVSVNGNLTIDGRDRTASGVLVAGTGTFGVFTTKTFSPGGSSQTGGTGGGIDYAPTGSPNPAVIKAGVSMPNFPATPDSVLGGAANGFPEGTLKQIAKSGAGGSQYSLGGAGLKNPLRGVTYVEGDFGGSMDGTGILIIHNSSKSAVYKNTSGSFKGIMIVDDIVHVHSNFAGAMVILTPNPSSGNVLGNGIGNITFSREIIYSATDSLYASANGSAITPTAWWE